MSDSQKPLSQTTLTEPQKKALQYLASVPWAAPSEIGQAMIADGARMKAQGMGRLGGTMATRLMKRGLVFPADSQRSGFPAYRISAAGREVLKD